MRLTNHQTYEAVVGREKHPVLQQTFLCAPPPVTYCSLLEGKSTLKNNYKKNSKYISQEQSHLLSLSSIIYSTELHVLYCYTTGRQ